MEPTELVVFDGDSFGSMGPISVTGAGRCGWRTCCSAPRLSLLASGRAEAPGGRSRPFETRFPFSVPTIGWVSNRLDHGEAGKSPSLYWPKDIDSIEAKESPNASAIVNVLRSVF